MLFYFTTFTIGGGLIGVHFLLQNPVSASANNILTFSSGYGSSISWLFVIIGFPIVWFFTKWRMDKHANEKIRYDQLYPVTIQINGKQLSTTGYIDSGNQLTDPLTKKPVIICDEKFMRQWFDDQEWKLLKEAHETYDLKDIPEQWIRLINMVPFHGVEGRNGFLLTIRPEQVVIYYGDDTISTNNLLIGILFSTLTADQKYHCLLHPQLIKLSSSHLA